MSLVEFLTSKEIIVVYAIAAVASLLCFIIFLVERNNDKARRKHNTRELNKLIEEVKDEIEVEEEIIEENPTIVKNIEIEKDGDITYSEIESMIEKTIAQEHPIVEIEDELKEETHPIITKVEEVKDSNIEYIEPTPSIEEAKEELHKVAVELQKGEEENIELTSYEVEQEENAIISLEELVKKGKEIYEKNELQESMDEGNEPISLHELEMRVGKTASSITDTFIIENVVSEEELIEEEPVIVENKKVINTPIIEKENGFIPSPIISPIYGIERELTKEELELENTADYEKLDAEIKKTNEFLMTLKELQKKLD